MYLKNTWPRQEHLSRWRVINYTVLFYGTNYSTGFSFTSGAADCRRRHGGDVALDDIACSTYTFCKQCFCSFPSGTSSFYQSVCDGQRKDRRRRDRRLRMWPRRGSRQSRKQLNHAPTLALIIHPVPFLILCIVLLHRSTFIVQVPSPGSCTEPPSETGEKKSFTVPKATQFQWRIHFTFN